MDTLAGALGKNIRRRRTACGLTQEELSYRADIHYTYLGHIERGNRLPSLEVLSRIVRVLSVSLSAILKGIR